MCPAATLALTLGYLRTNHQGIAAKFVIPDTRYLVDHIRPDFIFMRALGRNLILWDAIQPSEAWLLGQLPPLLRQYVHTVLLAPTNKARTATLGGPGSMSKPEKVAVAAAVLNTVAGNLAWFVEQNTAIYESAPSNRAFLHWNSEDMAPRSLLCSLLSVS